MVGICMESYIQRIYINVMKTKTREERLELVESYTVTGIPGSSISRMLKEMGLSESRFNKFMAGQTCGLVGGETMYYPWDVERFVKRLPVID